MRGKYSNQPLEIYFQILGQFHDAWWHPQDAEEICFPNTSIYLPVEHFMPGTLRKQAVGFPNALFDG